MSTLLHKLMATGNVKLSLTADGSVYVGSDTQLTAQQVEWLREHKAQIQRDLINMHIQQVEVPESIKVLLVRHKDLWAMLDDLADLAEKREDVWRQVFNFVIWWLSLCHPNWRKATLNDVSMILNLTR